MAEQKAKWQIIKRKANGEVYTVHVYSDAELGAHITATAESTPYIDILGMVKVS